MKYLLCIVLLSLATNTLANKSPEEQMANRLLDEQQACDQHTDACNKLHETCMQISDEEDKILRQWGQENSNTKEIWDKLRSTLDSCKDIK